MTSYFIPLEYYCWIEECIICVCKTIDAVLPFPGQHTTCVEGSVQQVHSELPKSRHLFHILKDSCTIVKAGKAGGGFFSVLLTLRLTEKVPFHFRSIQWILSFAATL